MNFRDGVRHWGGTALLLAGLLPAGAGCGGGNPIGLREKEADQLVAEGWQLFETSDFAAAVTKFSDAVRQSRQSGAGYNGLGWTHFRLHDLPTRNCSWG